MEAEFEVKWVADYMTLKGLFKVHIHYVYIHTYVYLYVHIYLYIFIIFLFICTYILSRPSWFLSESFVMVKAIPPGEQPAGNSLGGT